ncbi:MAG: SPFH domain-containing protein [Planctomycetaceae bacterium]
MSHTIFLERNRGKSWVAMTLGIVVLIVVTYMFYSMFRIDVGTGQIAVLIYKAGSDLKNDMEIAPGSIETPEYKGVQKKVLTEGRYFYNPFYWDWEIVDQKSIENGKLGVLVSLCGDDLPHGEFLARVKESDKNVLADPDIVLTKGIIPQVLNPGRYPINPYLFELEIHEPQTVPAGFKGVVTNLAGKIPAKPNSLLSEPGERGVQKISLDPGTYYVNPYVMRINLVDCRSQRFNIAEKKDMGFPSKDGFWVSLDGVIEFHVMPDKAADVYVIYNEMDNGEVIDEEIIRKVILPNARSFCRLQGSNILGREFMGDRSKFQESFQHQLREECQPQGIEIVQALVTRISPPEQILKPVREREIAKQLEKQFQQEILQQESEQKLAIEKALVLQKRALVTAEQQVIKLTTLAKQEQEVAITKGDEKKAVAQFRMDAAADEASAIMAKGKAAAEVVAFQNEAEAAGWKSAVAAFSGNGRQYSQYVLYQKLASAYRHIMVNTADSPIMKIFEQFAPDQVGEDARGSAPLKTAGSETPNP